MNWLQVHQSRSDRHKFSVYFVCSVVSFLYYLQGNAGVAGKLKKQFSRQDAKAQSKAG